MSKLEWDLSDLFTTNEQFYKSILKVQKLLDKILKYNITDAKSLLVLLEKYSSLKELNNNILVYGSLMYYKNVNSVETIKLKTDVEELNNKVCFKLKLIDKKIIDLTKNKINIMFNEEKNLKKYTLFIDNMFRMQEHIQDADIYGKIRNNNNSINEQISKYDDLLRDMKYGCININDEEIEVNVANFSKFISSKDRNTRKQTYFVVNNAYKDKEKDFASILNNIYLNRKNNSELEGYNNVLEKVLFEENIDVKIIRTLIKNVGGKTSLIQ